MKVYITSSLNLKTKGKKVTPKLFLLDELYFSQEINIQNAFEQNMKDIRKEKHPEKSTRFSLNLAITEGSAAGRETLAGNKENRKKRTRIGFER